MTASAVTPGEAITWRMAARAASHHSCGACSLHRGRGTSKEYSAMPIPHTAPDSSTTMALVAVVETSMPSTWGIGEALV